MTKALQDKIAIVTGASRGIGRAIAIGYAQAGAKVAVASRTRSSAAAVVKEINDAGGTAIGIGCNVGNREEIHAMIDATVEAFGGLQILVNNAQGHGTQNDPAPAQLPNPLEDTDEEQWEYVYRTGATATLRTMKAAFPHMKECGYGRIINLGSSSGQIGFPGNAAYNATKEAIRALTRTAAREWGRYGITANVINPMLETDALARWKSELPQEVARIEAEVPVRRIGEPSRDVAPLAVFLAGEGASYLTGMTYMVEGGLYTFA